MFDFIVDRRKARTEAATLAALRTPVMTLDANAIVLAANPAMADLLTHAAAAGLPAGGCGRRARRRPVP